MSKQKRGKERPDPLRGSIDKLRRREDGADLTLLLENPGARSAHYIKEIRNIKFDASANKLVIKMADEGRTLVPGLVNRIPKFGVIDPRSNQSVELNLPNSLVQLGEPNADGELTFDEIDISQVSEIEVDVGWSDTVYYPDTRESERNKSLADTWQVGLLQMRYKQ